MYLSKTVCMTMRCSEKSVNRFSVVLVFFLRIYEGFPKATHIRIIIKNFEFEVTHSTSNA